MADDHKKDFAIDVTINPYGECKKSEPPAWFEARPKLTKLVTDIQVKRTLKLDARKWKKKDLEDGVYAVAKYHLAMFSTALTTLEKDIDKTFDKKKENAKKKRDAKFYRNTKEESKEESAALSTAEKKVTALWKKIEKGITDKVSLALDEVEADKGDNKKAIAVGKQAIKVFDGMATNDVLDKPINDVASTLANLAKDIANNGGDASAAVQSAGKKLQAIEGEFDKHAKSTGKVAKMFLALGNKMSKDKKSDPELQSFGKTLANGTVKSGLLKLNADIKELGNDISDVVAMVAKGEADAKVIAQRASKFKGQHDKKKATAKDATKAMRKLSDAFKKIEKKLK